MTKKSLPVTGEVTDVEFEDVTNNVTNEPENDNTNTEDTEDRESTSDNDTTSDDVSTALQTQSKGVAQLDSFSNVEQVKQFAIQLGIPGSVESVARRIVTGKELGVPATVAMDNIFIINGRATLSVHLVNALLKTAGYEIRTIRDNEYVDAQGDFSPIRIDSGDKKSIDRCCTIKAVWKSKITGQVEEETYSYWWSEAIAAGLVKKATWVAYGRQLLWNRTLVFLARRIAADVLNGMYEYSEIADVENEKYQVTATGNAIPI